jgi:hypothetical protein
MENKVKQRYFSMTYNKIFQNGIEFQNGIRFQNVTFGSESSVNRWEMSGN